MNHVARAAILLVGLSGLTAAQNFAHLDDRSPSLKFDRRRIIGWDQLSRNANGSQVYLYNLLTKISLLRVVPEATAVAIDDAAITQSGMLVIAADYSRGKGTLASSMLLCFGFDGRLLSAGVGQFCTQFTDTYTEQLSGEKQPNDHSIIHTESCDDDSESILTHGLQSAHPRTFR